MILRCALRYAALLGLVAAGWARPAIADGWSHFGELAAELRVFPDDPASATQLEDIQGSLVVAPEVRWRSEDRRHEVKLSPYFRLDGEDDERTHFDLREGYYRYVGSNWEVVAGLYKVFWGVAEARHLVDTINQTDAVEDIDEEDKLGQPMLRLGLQRDWGLVELFALTGFRKRTFPGLDGRLRPPLPIDVDGAIFESGAEERRVDWAARWSHFIGSWDVGLHAFHGTGREPMLRFAPDGARLVPFYAVVEQLGVDVQHTRGAQLWKLEALARSGQGDTFGAVVAGLEYTFFQLRETSADLGVLVEYLYDGRDASAPATIYDDDTFVGARLALNDAQDTTLLAGAVIDLDDGTIAAVIEAERRLVDHLTLELNVRLFADVSPMGDLAAVTEDSFVTVRVAWSL